jgi:hypothetical protein
MMTPVGFLAPRLLNAVGAGLAVFSLAGFRPSGVYCRTRELWRKGRKRLVEIGGAPFPHVCPSEIAALAAAMIETRVTGGEPPMVPAGMPCGDVTAAVCVVETLLD